MGRLRQWNYKFSNARYRRLVEPLFAASDPEGDTADLVYPREDGALGLGGGGSLSTSWDMGVDGGAGGKKRKTCKPSKKKKKSGGRSGSSPLDVPEYNVRQQLVDSFKEVMTYSCTMCGHVQTVQVRTISCYHSYKAKEV